MLTLKTSHSLCVDLNVLSLFPYGMSGGFDPPTPETEHNLKLIKKFQVHVDVLELFLLLCE